MTDFAANGGLESAFDLGTYFRFLLALVFVLGLIFLATLAAKRMGFGFPTAAIRRAHKRLGIVEVAPIDGRRRLVLVRRDGTEHLLLLGPSTELVVERGIEGMADAFDTAPDPGPDIDPNTGPMGRPFTGGHKTLSFRDALSAVRNLSNRRPPPGAGAPSGSPAQTVQQPEPPCSPKGAAPETPNKDDEDKK